MGNVTGYWAQLKSEPNVYRCTYPGCKESNDKWRAIDSHYTSKHLSNLWTCYLCSFKASSRSKLISHIRNDHNNPWGVIEDLRDIDSKSAAAIFQGAPESLKKPKFSSEKGFYVTRKDIMGSYYCTFPGCSVVGHGAESAMQEHFIKTHLPNLWNCIVCKFKNSTRDDLVSHLWVEHAGLPIEGDPEMVLNHNKCVIFNGSEPPVQALNDLPEPQPMYKHENLSDQEIRMKPNRVQDLLNDITLGGDIV